MKSEKEATPTYDVIIIGAGIAGLTAAALLIKAGLKVAVFEEQPKPGGYFATFKRKGYTFDSSIQWLNQCNEGGFVNKILNYIGPDFPKCTDMNRIRRYKGESFDYLLTREPYKFRDQLINDFPEDTKGIIKLFHDCKKIGSHLTIMNRRMRATETMSLPEKIIYGLKMLWWVIPVWKYLRISAEEGLDKYFEHEGVKKYSAVKKSLCL